MCYTSMCMLTEDNNKKKASSCPHYSAGGGFCVVIGYLIIHIMDMVEWK